jgi:hypothetical protein
MSLTGSTAIKAWLENQSLGVSVDTRWRASPLPTIVVSGPYANPDDRTAAFSQKRSIPTYQIDVWQREFGPKDQWGKTPRLEDPLLPELVAFALDGAVLGKIGPSPGARIYRCNVILWPYELPEPEEANMVHHVIDVQLHRNVITHR